MRPLKFLIKKLNDQRFSTGSLDGLRIRHVARADLPALEWEGEFTHFRRLFTDAFRQAERGEAVLWIAELDNPGLVGQLFVQLDSHTQQVADGYSRAYIHAFRVRPQYRRLGIGSRLLEIAEGDLVRRGYQRVCLNVGRDNQDARRLYERFGYQVVFTEPGAWSYIDHLGNRREVHEPAWRMEKRLE